MDLLKLTEAARWLLEGLLLQHLGLVPETLDALLRRNEWLKRVGDWHPAW